MAIRNFAIFYISFEKAGHFLNDDPDDILQINHSRLSILTLHFVLTIKKEIGGGGVIVNDIYHLIVDKQIKINQQSGAHTNLNVEFPHF